MTNLQKLEQEIRTKIPRLMELSEGCLIRFTDGEIIKISQGMLRQIKNIDYRNEEFTIIGHEIQLNDVLEWLGMMDYNYCQTTEVNLLCITIESDDYYVSYWDLSKQYLKDQSEGLIKSLSELIL